ncbi:transglutaminase-like domain-containing protein [Akkermansiaceae bacterium]|nr:transglutaminase-like domain-containing protein [Akkermansiaceae bacterium]MDB4538167.1 transglutaminase-like domain-containing protein [Akkermansiaceae bacterium]
MSRPEISTILRLLDDEDQEVQDGIQQALIEYHGDASDDLAALGIKLAKKESSLLSKSLHPGRQATLREHWSVPARALKDPDGDWDALEALLRLLSDFLHDGIILRPSMSDELDLLAREAENNVHSPAELAEWLFASDRFTGNKANPYDPRNSDLAWCLEEGKGNPLALSLIYLLIARRIDVPVYGVNYPGHFLCLIDLEVAPTLIDPYHRGRPIPVMQLLKDHPEISKKAVEAVRRPCSLAAILSRVLANMNLAFSKINRFEDADLIQNLMKTIKS